MTEGANLPSSALGLPAKSGMERARPRPAAPARLRLFLMRTPAGEDFAALRRGSGLIAKVRGQ
jgi:hypothetical protein